MMIRVQKLIETADIFAPHFEFYIDKSSTRYSTFIGGTYTLISVNLSLIFAVLKIYSWYTLQIMPIVITYGEYPPLARVDLNNLNLRITNTPKYFDVIPLEGFNSKEKVLFIPYLEIYSGQKLQYFHPLSINCDFPDDSSNQFYTFCFPKEYLDQAILESGPSVEPQFLNIRFLNCNESLLVGEYENKTCLSPELKQQYMMTHQSFWVYYQLENYDFSQNCNTVVPRMQILNDLWKRETIPVITLKSQHQQINYGYSFFEKPKINNIIMGLNIAYYKPGINFTNLQARASIESVITDKADSVFGIDLSSQREVMRVEYLQFFDLVALIASFFRIWMSIGNIFVKRKAVTKLLSSLAKSMDIYSTGGQSLENCDPIEPKMIKSKQINFNVRQLFTTVQKLNDEICKIYTLHTFYDRQRRSINSQNYESYQDPKAPDKPDEQQQENNTVFASFNPQQKAPLNYNRNDHDIFFY